MVLGRRYGIFALIILSANMLYSQATNFNTQRNWSLNKKEILIGFGPTNFLGDLGGANAIGRDYSLKDLDLNSTSMGGMLGFRYRFHPYYSTTTVLNFGMVRGNDARTEEVIRNSRNLSFRSPILNLSQRLEFIFLANEKVGRRMNIQGLKGMNNHNGQLYVFTGIGIALFNPKANYNGAWVALKPLRTEGEGLPGGAAPYHRYTATIPFGIGGRIGISKMWRVGLEVTYVKTFSDYIDDVHGVYYDPAVLKTKVGPESAALSNPAKKNAGWFSPGQQRGDKQNDALLYINLTVYKNITYKSYSHRSRIKFGKYKAKF